jgi:hypothetical protein
MTVLVLGALGCALLVLPGFALRTLTRRPPAPPLDELELAVATTVVAVAVVGVALVGFRQFSATRMAVPFMLLALVGIPRAARWTWPLLRRPQPYLVLALTAPWAWMAQRPGNPPAGLLHWYYWNLATALSKAHGVPSFVTEYGQQIRWLPDYLIFNIVSETYRGAAVVGTSAQQLAALRIPIALLGIIAVYGVARLWLRSVPAMTGTALIVATQLFGDKFNAYKPESFAIMIGLIAVRLCIVGLRRRETPLLLIAGVLVGINLGVHAIAAVVMAMLLASAVVAEVVVSRDTRRWRTIGALFLAGAIALGVTAGTGWALQGRALVISDAAQPARRADGRDPTLLFLARNSGQFGELHEKSLGDELSTNLQEPWRGFHLASVLGILLGVAVIAGIAVGLATGSRALRKAVITMFVFSVVLTLAAAYFGLSYDTYVPRHTGLFRFVQYAPLVAAILVAIAIEGIALRLEPVSDKRRTRYAQIAVASGLVLGAAAIGIVLTVQRFRNFQSVSPEASAVLDRLARQARPGDAILTNVGTRGTFEFWTGIEDPLEGRQALIEKPAFVAHATSVIEATHRFFTGTGSADLPDRLGINWIVVARQPSDLGASASWGTPPEGWTVPGFTAEPATGGLVVMHRPGVHPGREYVGEAEDRGLETLVVLIAAALALAVTWWLLAGRSRSA